MNWEYCFPFLVKNKLKVVCLHVLLYVFMWDWWPLLCVQGPEFVQKHLLTRHGEQVEEVRKEAVFFNNFLMDPKRPTLPPEMRSPPPMPTRPGQGD